MWCVVSDWMSPLEILSPKSLLLPTVVPTAAMAVAAARRYASDKQRCTPGMTVVLMAADAVAQAALQYHPDTGASTPASAVLACQDVMELVLLAFAVGVQQLHAESKGVSSLKLPKSSSSSSSSGSSSASRKTSWRIAVSPNHQELLHVLLGTRQLDNIHLAARELMRDRSVTAAAESINRICAARFHTIKAAGQPSDTNPGGSSSSPGGSRFAVNAVRQAGQGDAVVPWNLLLPLRLSQLELLGLMPPACMSDEWGLWTVQTLLQDMFNVQVQYTQLSSGKLHMQQEGEQQQQQPPQTVDLPPLDAVKNQAQLVLRAALLELGPALLALCSRRPDKCVAQDTTTPRQMYAAYAEVLEGILCSQGTQLDCKQHVNGLFLPHQRLC